MEMYKLKLSREELIKSLEELYSFLIDCCIDIKDEGPATELELSKWIASVGYALMELRKE